jgi:hypothetical protein
VKGQYEGEPYDGRHSFGEGDYHSTGIFGEVSLGLQRGELSSVVRKD